MKVCPKCKKLFSDDFSFCDTCGFGLVERRKGFAWNKGTILALVVVVIVAAIGIGLAVSQQMAINDNKREIEQYKYNKELQEYLNTPTTSDLRINSNWTTEKERNYIYIRGSVTNTSLNKTISYFAVEAKFYDMFGDIIDTDWTNDGTDLAPGETRQFEIMHKYNSDEKDIKLFVKDVS